MGLGSGIRDPGSGKNLFRIPDPGVKKAPDPGSGSATLPTTPFSLVLSKEYFDCPHFIKKSGERGGSTLVLCRLATVTSCMDLSVRIVTKFPKVGPLLIFSISLRTSDTNGDFLNQHVIVF
jgi:hypothetical protein